MSMQYPCNVFFMREDKTTDVLYLLEDPQRTESTVLGSTTKNSYRMDKCEVSSLEDVLNVRHLPGFVRYLPEELDTFVKEHLTKECL